MSKKAAIWGAHSIHPGVLVPVLVVLVSLAGCPSIAPLERNITYQRVPTAVDRVAVVPEVITLDNCDSNANQERWLDRSLTIGEVVSLDREEVRSVAAVLGVSAGVDAEYYVGASAGLEANLEFQKTISERVGTGLTSGQTKTQGVKIAVGPRQTAVTTLQWIETWEDGYVEVFYASRYVGRINYHLLVDLRLDSSTKTYDCSLIGRAKQALASGTARVSISARSTWETVSEKFSQLKSHAKDKWQSASDAWPLGHLEWWVAGGVGVIGGLVGSLICKRRRARPDRNDDSARR